MIKEIFLLQNPWRENEKYHFNLEKRQIFDTLLKNIDNELILGLIGSRQVGKSSILYLLIEKLLESGVHRSNIFYFTLDDFKLHELFGSVLDFIQFIGKDDTKKYVFIDEVQRLPSPGLFLKEIFDLKRNIKIIFSGSSQLEVKAKTKEHLVGRARVFQINRLSFSEYLHFATPITKKEAFEQILIYGSYPAVATVSEPIEKKLRIKDIFQSYIQKDVTDFLQVKKVDVYNKLLTRLATNIGDLLNIHELSKSLAAPRNEIEKYIDMLENTFICSRIYPFHKNLNKEITKTPKIYFLDLGLRNYILSAFNELDKREDTGKLFENFYYNELLANDFFSFNKINFWRTTNQTEIDFIVQGEDITEAIKVKWKATKSVRAFHSFQGVYPEIKTKVVQSSDFT